MELLVNGEVRAARPNATIMTFLEEVGLNPAKVAVERNREIVPKSLYAQTALAEGDRLEIVVFVGGG